MPIQWLAVRGAVSVRRNELVVGQVGEAEITVVPLPQVLLEPQSTSAVLAAVSTAFIGSLKVTLAVALSATSVVAALGDVEETVGALESEVAVATFEPMPIPPLPETPKIS